MLAAMTWGDGASIAAAVVAVIAAVAAGRQAVHARTAAEAAEKSAAIAQDALALEQARFEAEHPSIAFEVEHVSGDKYRLKNTGRETATGVSVTANSPLTRDLPAGITLRPGEAASFFIFGALQAPVPDAVSVQWDGHNQPPLSVPIPRR